MGRKTRALIDLGALRHNLQCVRQRLATDVQILTVIKANGYGHGIVPVAKNLTAADGFAVATFAEAMTLRQAGITQFILLLEGALDIAELQQAAAQGFGLVIHQQWQLEQFMQTGLSQPVAVWLKVDTGMNRLGIAMNELETFWQPLRTSDKVQSLVLMSHMACADEKDHPLNSHQQNHFHGLIQRLRQQFPHQTIKGSLANSAATLRGPELHYQWVRPGLMLYGACPWLECAANDLGLLPVMQLESSVIALKYVAEGDSVGYGATWQAPFQRRLAVVSIGYGDGYPRHVAAGAYVLIEGVRCPIVGRVSMDMMTVDVTDCPAVQIDSKVILWGQGLPVENVARWAGSVNYELLCQVTPRVERIYEHGLEL